MGTIRAASLATSPRLARVQALLADGQEHSTLQIMAYAHVCAVSACMAELRAQGAVIACRQTVTEPGQRVWFYRMICPAGAQTQPMQGQSDGD